MVDGKDFRLTDEVRYDSTLRSQTRRTTDANFTIEWEGHYRIEGAAFIFIDRKIRGTRTILGYPTQKLEHAANGG
jgi:hypothetical protein